MSSYLHLSTPDPDFIAAAAALGPRPPFKDIHDLRNSVDSILTKAIKAAHPVSYPESVLSVTERKVPVNGGEIDVRLYVPKPTAGSHENEGHRYPLLVWLHGGGHCIGNLDIDDYRLQDLAVENRISVVSVGYRLAPEFPFPIPLEDSYAGLKWAETNSKEILDADVTKGFLLGGVSAGATMTAVITHQARDDPEFKHKLTGQILETPLVIEPSVVPDEYKSEYLSYEQNRDAPILSAAMIKVFYDNYAFPDPADPRVSPLLFPSHAGLPPANIRITGLDPLRDDGFIYDRVLREAGIKTKVHVYPGVPHGFNLAFSKIPAGVKWDTEFKEGVQWLLNNLS